MRLKTTLFLFATMLFAYQVSAQCNADFQEVNGIAILEMEAKSGQGFNNLTLSGASGGRGLAYQGSNRFGAPGTPINYTVRINSPGTYRFIWRNRIGVIASSNAATEHNDAWLRITGGNSLFYGGKGSASGSRVYPGGSGRFPVAEGNTSGGFFKIYTNTINWSWATWTSDFDGHFIYANFPSAGTYTIQVAGRSNGHWVDRMVLFKEGSYTVSQASSLSRAVTSCSGGTTPTPPTPPTPPADNTPPSVSFTNLSNGQTFANGSTITVGVSSSDSDGSITRHQIFVNNSLVDTDGSSYSPHQITNASAGSYVIRATVTDNSGATTSTTATVSVGGSTTPTPPTPPTPPTTGNTAPTVSFSGLSNGQTVAAGSTVRVNLSANDSDGSITRHQIFVNGTLVDTDGSSYTPHVISGIQSGSYTIMATVTDNDGATASSTVSITAGSGTPTTPPTTGGDDAPVVNITNLSNGQQVAVGSTVSVQLAASDADGSVVRHQIYVNGTLVDTDGGSYTAHPIRNIQAGSYVIRATVTDNDGSTDSDTVTITAGSGTTPTPTPGGQISFSLINASTNGVVGSISNGTTLSSSQGVNIRANVPSNTNSVRLTLSGAQSNSRVEGVAPYALYGDINGNYVAVNFSNGSYSIRAIAYSGSNGTGSVIADTTISFSVGSSASGKAPLVPFAYPNPIKADGRVSIKLPNGGTGSYGYSISNSSGVIIDSGKFNADASSTDVNLQLSNVGRQGEGVYYMTLMSSDAVQTIPIIRE
ncbi:MAG: Ig-like domain-containing protein [Maribacter sp.]